MMKNIFHLLGDERFVFDADEVPSHYYNNKKKMR